MTADTWKSYQLLVRIWLRFIQRIRSWLGTEMSAKSFKFATFWRNLKIVKNHLQRALKTPPFIVVVLQTFFSMNIHSRQQILIYIERSAGEEPQQETRRDKIIITFPWLEKRTQNRWVHVICIYEFISNFFYSPLCTKIIRSFISVYGVAAPTATKSINLQAEDTKSRSLRRLWFSFDRRRRLQSKYVSVFDTHEIVMMKWRNIKHLSTERSQQKKNQSRKT